MSTYESTHDDRDEEQQSVTIPTKDVDPDETVQDRLTENVKNRIGPARYFDRDEDGNSIEDWSDTFHRVASNVAEAELTFGGDRSDYLHWQKTFEQAMGELRFVPNSPTLMNAGLDLQQLSACFVIEPRDSMDDINQSQSDAAAVFKSGGGVGYPFHHLRPKGARVASTGGVSSGPLSFMQLFDTTCGTVKQGGCVATDERVMTDSGYLPLSSVHDGPPLQDAPNGESFVYTRGGNFDTVVESSDSGSMPVLELTTASGYSITVSHDHEVLVLRDDGLEFVESEQIDETDTIVCSQNDKRTQTMAPVPDPNTDSYHTNANTLSDHPDAVTDNLARFIGVLLGDGTVDVEYNRVIFSLGNDGNGDMAAQEFVTSYLDRLGVSYITTDKSSDGSEKGNYTEIRVNSEQLVSWLVSMGVDGDRTVPEIVYQSPGSIPAFLDGLTVDATYNDDANTFVYSTAHRDFADEIQDLLLVCGVPSTVSRVDADDARYSDEPHYTVRIHPGRGAATFNDTINTFLDGYDPGRGGQRQNQFASSAWVDAVLDKHFERHTELSDSVDADALSELRRYARGDRTPSLHRLRSSFESVGIDPDEYDELDRENLFEPVVSISETTAPVCDIENKTGDPEYVASNVVVHNKRRGAQMAIMHVQHPDIGRFGVSKRGEDTFTNFNISMGITDDFIEAVQNDEMYTLYDPTTRPSENHDLCDGEPFEVVPETANFYDPELADAWNDEYDKPGVGYDGVVVDENFWRDYVDDMSSDFSEFRDRIDIEPGDEMQLPARFIWQILIDGAWNNGEPGIFYLDETNREHSFDVDEHPEHFIHSTNPCSEQMLEEYEPCNLGHVNLSLMVDDTAPLFDEFRDRHDIDDREQAVHAYLNRALDHNQFVETVETGTRFLENVVTQSDFPIPEITQAATNKRKIGLGLMGFHQMLMQMGVEYGSEISYEFAREIMRRIDKTATDYSHKLASERDPFPEYGESKWADPTAYPEWFRTHAHRDPDNWSDGFPMRNHNVTTIAPTGTTSLIGNTTGGCEPIPHLAYMKNVGDDIQGDEHLVEFDDYFIEVLDANGIDVEAVKAEAHEQMLNNEFEGADGLDTVPDRIGELFTTTNDLSGEQHVRVQAAFQEYCDSGISKTLNMPTDTSIDEVGNAFMLALELGIKGTTVYRDGSRNEQVIKDNVEERKFTDEEREELLEDVQALVRTDDDARDLVEQIVSDEAESNGGEN